MSLISLSTAAAITDVDLAEHETFRDDRFSLRHISSMFFFLRRLMLLYYRYILGVKVMDLFSKRNPDQGRRTLQIKSQIGDLLELNQDATVMVTELELPGRGLSGG
jgi:hypothetical protein